jgi:hypothetical protein
MRLAILSIVAMMLTGCAGTSKRPRAGADLNQAKITQVEQVAFARGVKVIWVNPPTTRAD